MSFRGALVFALLFGAATALNLFNYSTDRTMDAAARSPNRGSAASASPMPTLDQAEKLTTSASVKGSTISASVVLPRSTGTQASEMNAASSVFDNSMSFFRDTHRDDVRLGADDLHTISGARAWEAEIIIVLILGLLGIGTWSPQQGSPSTWFDAVPAPATPVGDVAEASPGSESASASGAQKRTRERDVKGASDKTDGAAR